MKVILSIVSWMLLVVAIVTSTLFVYNKDTHDVKFKTDLDTVTYNETNDTSSFDLNVKAIFKRYKILVATDIQCKMIFKAKDGTVLSENVVAFGQDICGRKAEITFSFGEGELAAVSGKFHSVDVELQEANFVNYVSFVGDTKGFKYLFTGWNNIFNYAFWPLASLFYWVTAWCGEKKTTIARVNVCVMPVILIVLLSLLIPTMVVAFLA